MKSTFNTCSIQAAACFVAVAALHSIAFAQSAAVMPAFAPATGAASAPMTPGASASSPAVSRLAPGTAAELTDTLNERARAGQLKAAIEAARAAQEANAPKGLPAAPQGMPTGMPVGGAGQMPMSSPAALGLAPPKAVKLPPARPRLLSIRGLDGQLSARISVGTESAITSDSSKGLPQGWLMTELSSQRAVVTKGKERLELFVISE